MAGRSPDRDTIFRAIGVVLLLVAGIGFALPAAAAKTIYKCTQTGQVVLTDKPCESTTSPEDTNPSTKSQSNVTTIASSSNPSTVGVWRGQMQYQGHENGQMLDKAHSVVPLSLEFTADGKVSGSSVDNGCKWLGVWSQGGRIITIDMSLTGCSYTGLNRRFAGTFLLGVPDSSGEMMLQAFTIPVPGQAARGYDIKGTLRR
jgi:Domain of unknown function (DUF4124)